MAGKTAQSGKCLEGLLSAPKNPFKKFWAWGQTPLTLRLMKGHTRGTHVPGVLTTNPACLLSSRPVRVSPRKTKVGIPSRQNPLASLT